MLNINIIIVKCQIWIINASQAEKIKNVLNIHI